MLFADGPEYEKQLQELREQKRAGGDRDLFFHTGFFISSYAIVEMRVSMLLAAATGVRKLQSFDLLTRGMDLRVKINRLRRACEKKPRIGENIDARLTIMDKTMRPIRNKMAHQAAILSGDGKKLSFASLAAMPDWVTPRHPDQTNSTNYDALEIFECASWMKMFNQDLKAATESLNSLGIIETENPTSPLLRAVDQSPDRPKPAATLNRRQRRRARKGQPLRGKVTR